MSASHEWKNKSESCQKDPWQTIFDNSEGDEKEKVFFTIVNRGKCSVVVGIAETEGQKPTGKEKSYPSGSDRRVTFTVPKGHYLIAACTSSEESGCNWTISDFKP